MVTMEYIYIHWNILTLIAPICAQILSHDCNGRVIGSLCLTYSGDRKENWFNAETACASIDGHLVAVVNETLQNDILQILNDNGVLDQPVWLGAREVKAASWQWLANDADLGYQGCFQDNLLDNDMDVLLVNMFMTIEWCINECLKRGYLYAGLQNRGFCFCADHFGRHGNSAGCGLLCPGNASQSCGGSTSNDVYAVNGTSTFWISGQPNDYGGYQHCMVLSANDGFKMDDKACERSCAYVCHLASCSVAQYGGELILAKDGRCYFISRVAKVWFQAQEDCFTRGGYLTEIDTESNWIAIQSAIQDTGIVRNLYWVGATRRDIRWTTGKRVLYSRWGTFSPSVYTDQCVSLNPQSGRWTDGSCVAVNSYICQQEIFEEVPATTLVTTTVIPRITRSTATPPVTMTTLTPRVTRSTATRITRSTNSPQVSIATDAVDLLRWKTHCFSEGHCYILFANDKQMILSAEQICQQHGGHLATINDNNQQLVVERMMAENNLIDLWIGASEAITQTWKWTDETLLKDQGCFKDRIRNTCLSSEYEYNKMTPEWCIEKCRNEGYAYAALQSGSRCFCGETLTGTGTTDSCREPCTGNSSLTCGGLEACNIYAINGVFGLWSFAQPNNFNDDQACASMFLQNEYHFTSQECEKSFLYICNIKASSCFNNEIGGSYAVDFTGNCYFHSSQPKPWFHAREDCVQRNGDLLTLRSADNWTSVISQVNNLGRNPEHIWIGLARKEIRWINGENSRYTLWRDSTAPDRAANQCTKVTYRIGEYNWLDTECSDFYSYLCQTGKSASGDGIRTFLGPLMTLASPTAGASTTEAGMNPVIIAVIVIIVILVVIALVVGGVMIYAKYKKPLGKVRPSAKAPDEIYSPWDVDYAYSNATFPASPDYTFETKDSDSVAFDQYFPQYVAEGNVPMTSTVRDNGGRIIVE